MYKLNPYEYTIMSQVRELMNEDLARLVVGKKMEYSEYICLNIAQVLREHEGVFYTDDLTEHGKALYTVLKSAVQSSIDPYSSVFSWLANQHVIRPKFIPFVDFDYKTGRAFYKACNLTLQQARCAWLDKIIETETI